MLTGQSIRACLRREVPTDHEADAAETAAGTSVVRTRELRRLSLSFGGSVQDDRIRTQTDHLTRMTTETRGTRAAECTIVGSRAKPDERCRTLLAYRPSRQRLQRRSSLSDAQSGPHVARRTPRPCRRQGGQLSSEQSRSNQALGSLTSTHSAWRERSLPQSGAGDSQTTRST